MVRKKLEEKQTQLLPKKRTMPPLSAEVWFQESSMTIAEHKVVSIHYTLRDPSGAVIDSSEGNEPLQYIQGMGNIIPGLESAMLGKNVGDKLDVVVDPKEGYGERSEDLIQVLPRSMFAGIDTIEIGQQFQATGGNGPVVITVTEVGDDTVTVDGNHELAGVELHFAVEVVDIRDATAEEILHGHTHSGGGCCGGGHHHDDDDEHAHEHEHGHGGCGGGGCHSH